MTTSNRSRYNPLNVAIFGLALSLFASTPNIYNPSHLTNLLLNNPYPITWLPDVSTEEQQSEVDWYTSYIDIPLRMVLTLPFSPSAPHLVNDYPQATLESLPPGQPYMTVTWSFSRQRLLAELHQLIAFLLSLSFHDLIILTDSRSFNWLYLGCNAHFHHYAKGSPYRLTPYQESHFSILSEDQTYVVTLNPTAQTFNISRNWLGINWHSTNASPQQASHLPFLQQFTALMDYLFDSDASLMRKNLGSLSAHFYFTLYSKFYSVRNEFDCPTRALIEALENLPCFSSSLLSTENATALNSDTFWPWYQANLNSRGIPITLNASNNCLAQSVSDPSLDNELTLLNDWFTYFQKPNPSFPSLPEANPSYEYSCLFTAANYYPLQWTARAHSIPGNPPGIPMTVYDVNSLYPYALKLAPIGNGNPNIITDPNTIQSLIGRPRPFVALASPNPSGFQFYQHLEDYLIHLISPEESPGFGWATVSFPRSIMPYAYSSQTVPYLRWFSITELRYFLSLGANVRIETLFIYSALMDFSAPISVLGDLKITGGNLPHKTGMQTLANQLLNAFWGNTLAFTPPSFSFQEPWDPAPTTTLHFQQVGNHTLGWQMTEPDQILFCSLPGYTLTNESFVLLQGPVFDNWEHLIQCAQRPHLTALHCTPESATQEWENYYKLPPVQTLLEDFAKTTESSLNTFFLKNLSTSSNWTCQTEYNQYLDREIAQWNHPELTEGNKKALFLHWTNGASMALNPYYFPEIGLETLTSGSIYMHVLCRQLQSMGYPIMNVNTDAVYLRGQLPSSLTSQLTFGWLNLESGPHPDWLLNPYGHLAYYGTNFYSGAASNVLSDYAVVPVDGLSPPIPLHSCPPSRLYDLVHVQGTHALVRPWQAFDGGYQQCNPDLWGWLGQYIELDTSFDQDHLMEAHPELLYPPYSHVSLHAELAYKWMLKTFTG